MPFAPSIEIKGRLTLEEAKQITGEWMTYCRQYRRPGEPVPDIVRKAAKKFAAKRNESLTQDDWERIAEDMRAKRAKKGYKTSADIVKSFPSDHLPSSARVVILKRTTASKVRKDAWNEVFLELDHDTKGYVHRFKATPRGFVHRISRTSAGKPPAGSPKTSTWESVSLAEAAKISPIARSFLFHMSTKRSGDEHSA